jgi:hypothetical protein
LAERRRTAKLAGFSEPAQEIPLDTIAGKTQQAFGFGTFPPIHSTRHNNKTPVFRKRTLRTVVVVKVCAL